MAAYKTNKEILDIMSKRVYGHEHAKKILINAVNRSKLRYFQRYGDPNGTPEEDLIPLSNCLLIGDSGTGKTLLIETLSDIMSFPYLKLDATELNPTGAHSGIKQTDLIAMIHKTATEAMERNPRRYFSFDGAVEQTIVFIDEIDKICTKFSSSNWNEHVQSNFLTLFENKSGLQGVTFIFAGAFTGLEKYASINKNKNIGFHNQQETKEIKPDVYLNQEIIKFGMLPELLGRIQHILLLDELTIDSYRQILIHNLLPRIKKNLQLFGVNKFTLTEKQIIELTTAAKESGLGVRNLDTSLSRLVVDLEFEHGVRLGL